MSIPKVYSAISAVAGELAQKGIPKSRLNVDEKYEYRGIDDVYDRLSPLLATHKLCILPRVLERVCTDRAASTGDLLVNVSVKTAFDLVSAEDGSVHVIEAYGEALDRGDKATSKAMTAAFKYAVLQTFCIPVAGTDDADAVSHRLRKSDHIPEPVQGWEQWVADISEMLRVCDTSEALDRVQNSNRNLLRAINRERPDLYALLGDAISARRRALLPHAKPVVARKRATRSAARRTTLAKGGSIDQD